MKIFLFVVAAHNRHSLSWKPRSKSSSLEKVPDICMARPVMGLILQRSLMGQEALSVLMTMQNFSFGIELIWSLGPPPLYLVPMNGRCSRQIRGLTSSWPSKGETALALVFQSISGCPLEIGRNEVVTCETFQTVSSMCWKTHSKTWWRALGS